jgi:capsular polysaccharide biosynthesis protein
MSYSWKAPIVVAEIGSQLPNLLFLEGQTLEITHTATFRPVDLAT